MIKMMVVDDEPHALRWAEEVIGGIAECQICGLYTSADDCFAQIVHDQPHLILLDIEMPGMQGLKAAQLLHALYPELAVVFSTAYGEYAAQAFEVNAVDYLLKPLTEPRVRQMIERYCRSRPRAMERNGNYTPRYFGPFRLKAAATGKSVEFRTAKARELAAFLLLKPGEPVSRDQILETIWPEWEADRAQSNLHTTVYQLRKDLTLAGITDDGNAVRSTAGLYSFQEPSHDGDLQLFERAYSLFSQGDDAIFHASQALALYRDGFMSGCSSDWVLQKRGQLEQNFLEMLTAVIDDEVRHQKYSRALTLLYRYIDCNPYAEQAHGQMIGLQWLLHGSQAAASYRRQMVEQFRTDLGVEPRIDMDKLAGNPLCYFGMSQ